MKHCELVDIELTPSGALYKGAVWPAEIIVMRELVDYPQGPHVQFGRRGALQFFCANASATYRRFEDRFGGWLYKLVDGMVAGATAAKPATNPLPAGNGLPAARQYKHNANGAMVEAFQWLPHAVPPVDLPDWFVRSDFEQNKEGALIVRVHGGVVRAVPGNWIVRSADGKLSASLPSVFAENYGRG